MANLLITRHVPHFHGMRRHLASHPLKIGKHFLMFVMIVMAGIMSLLYLMQFTDIHTKGYQLRKLEIEREQLQVVQETKQMNLAKVKSLEYVQNSQTVQQMIQVKSPIYLKPENEVASR